MNTDIRLSVGFWQHPKTKKTVKRLGLEGIRSLQVLWLWASQNRPDGLLSGMDEEEIELAADWQGEEGLFFGTCAGMWLDKTPEGYALHDWEKHNPWQAEAEARSEAGRKAAKARWSNAEASNGQKKKDARSMRDQCASNADAFKAQCPSPFLSSPSQEDKDTHTHPRARAKSKNQATPEKKKYGENQLVMLTVAEYDNLCANFGQEKTQKAISLLDLHIGAKGKDEYKSHNLALQKWVFNAVDEREARQARASPGLMPTTYAQAKDYDRRRQGSEALEIAKQMRRDENGYKTNDLQANQTPQRSLPAGDIRTFNAGYDFGLGR